MVSCYVAVGLYSGVLAAVTGFGIITPFLLLGLSLLLGTAFAFAGPASFALAANAVPLIDLPSAVSLQSAANNLTRVVGPVLAAPLLATGRFESAFATYIVVAGISAVMVGRMRPATFVPDDDDLGIFGRLAQGLRHAQQRRPALPALVTVATMSLFGVSHVALLPVYAEDILGTRDMFAWLVVSTGLGAMCGALATGFERSDPTLRGAALRMLFYGLSLSLFSLTNSPVLALVTQFAVGYFYFAVMTGLQTLIQQLVDEQKRGRVMSIFQVCWAGLVPFGGLAMGIMGGSAGLVPTLAGAGLVCAAYAVGVLALAARLTPPDVRGSIP